MAAGAIWEEEANGCNKMEARTGGFLVGKLPRQQMQGGQGGRGDSLISLHSGHHTAPLNNRSQGGNLSLYLRRAAARGRYRIRCGEAVWRVDAVGSEQKGRKGRKLRQEAVTSPLCLPGSGYKGFWVCIPRCSWLSKPSGGGIGGCGKTIRNCYDRAPRVSAILCAAGAVTQIGRTDGRAQ